MGAFPFPTGDILRGSDPTGNPFSVALSCSWQSPPPVATHTGGPDPPPDRLRRRRPRHPCGSPGSPRPLFFRLPPSLPGSERAPTGAHKPFFFVQTRALLCTASLLLDVSGFSFFVCCSTIKYNVTWHPRAPSLLSSSRLQRHQRAVCSTKRRSVKRWDARKNVYLLSLLL